MSIAYFPDIYDDELVYSVLARAYMHGGYMNYKNASVNFFLNPKTRVEKELLKNLKPEVIELLTRNMNLEELIEKHTMYPLYGRFIAKERRKTAYRAVKKGEGDFSKLFGVPNNKGNPRYLKYCPICSMEDRQLLGETYWRREHQLRGLEICHKHKCYLLNSTVSMDSRDAVNLVSAEEVVPERMETKICENPIEIRLAEYMINVFHKPIDRNNVTSVAKFLHARLVGTPYISHRGEHKYYTKLWIDMRKFYESVSLMSGITSGHIQRLLAGTRIVFEEICALALFLGIPADELARLETPLVSPEQEFDQRVMKLLNSGMTVTEVAKALGVSTSIVRMSREIDSKGIVVQGSGGRKIVTVAIVWDELDRNTINKVQPVIAELHGENGNRPKRVSVYAVAKQLNMPTCRLQKLKNCLQEIEANRLSDEMYHARKIKWAINVLEQQKLPIKMWRICAIAKLEKEDICNCLQELKKMVVFKRVALVEKELNNCLYLDNCEVKE